MLRAFFIFPYSSKGLFSHCSWPCQCNKERYSSTDKFNVRNQTKTIFITLNIQKQQVLCFVRTQDNFLACGTKFINLLFRTYGTKGVHTSLHQEETDGIKTEETPTYSIDRK